MQDSACICRAVTLYGKELKFWAMSYSGAVFRGSHNGELMGLCNVNHQCSYTDTEHLSSHQWTKEMGVESRQPNRHTSTRDATVQTELPVHFDVQPSRMYEEREDENYDQREMSTLSASDLASVLQWSKDISSDINLSSGKLGRHFVFMLLTPCL